MIIRVVMGNIEKCIHAFVVHFHVNSVRSQPWTQAHVYYQIYTAQSSRSIHTNGICPFSSDHSDLIEY